MTELNLRLTTTVALTSVFPYLPEMIESFDVPPDEVAKWVPLSSFTIIHHVLLIVYIGRLNISSVFSLTMSDSNVLGTSIR